jgi:uncharacterized protein YecE (DUF72 family)
MTEFRIGTSAFTAAGWENAFYLAGTRPELQHWQVTSLVEKWRVRTPSGSSPRIRRVLRDL